MVANFLGVVAQFVEANPIRMPVGIRHRARGKLGRSGPIRHRLTLVPNAD